MHPDSNQRFPARCRRPGRAMLLLLGWLAAGAVLGGADGAARAQSSNAPRDDLSIEQARLADRFERLEMVLGRLAELSAGTDPRRAKLLRETIAKSRQQAVDDRFETIVTLLEDQRLSAASNRQGDLQKDLDALLTLLLQADRDRQRESQHQRIKEYMKEVGRLIRLQKGVKARTEGGDGTERLAQDQQALSDKTRELEASIKDRERQEADEQPSDHEPGDDDEQGPDSSTESPSESKGESDQPAPEQPNDGQPQPDQAPQESPDGEPAPPDQEGAPAEPGQSPPSPGSQPPAPPSGGGAPSREEPTDRAAQRLQSAQQRMQQAQQQLEAAERDGAADQQQQAVEQLEQAKAELERVLRQLREEEMERTLTLLAARFRKMLEAQLKIYDGTVRLDEVPTNERDHDQEIEAARLSREEATLAREADRALVLLREEGSSVAFPETVSLMRDDMRQVTERLAEMKVGPLTQGLEQDIIESLEESLAALDKAIKDLERDRTPPGKSPPAGQPTEPPLVDKLAELKMIRALQMRVNRRTQRYGAMIEGEQAPEAELHEALSKLADRQQRIYRATYDLSQGRND